MKVTLEVLENNDRARRLYESAGFAPMTTGETGGRALFYARTL